MFRQIARTVFVTAAVLLAVAPAQPAGAEANVAVLVLDGKGHGHGVGLSQWGAESMARHGRSAAEILATFYPGTGLGASGGAVRVPVVPDSGGPLVLSFPQGGEVRGEGQGFPVRVGPGGQVRLGRGGAGVVVEPLVTAQSSGASAYRSSPGQDCQITVLCPSTTTPTTAAPIPTPAPTTTAAPQPGGGGGGGGGSTTTTAAPLGPGPEPAPAPPPAPPASAGSVVAVPDGGGSTGVAARGRAYRGTVTVTPAGGGLRAVNELDVETYLRGMAEVPGGWPAAAVQAQTIAARTYALRAMQVSGEICDTVRCQVYIGVAGESAGQNAAVDATRGQVLTHGGSLIAAVYSADAGGISATTAEGFGTPDGVYPYLRAVKYPTDNPLPWHAEVALSDVASRLAYPGELTSVAIAAQGESGRATKVRLEGSAGHVEVEALRFANALGLRSTLWQPTVSSAATAPPPPAATGTIQELPGAVTSGTAPVVRPSHQKDRIGSESLPAGVADVLTHPATLLAVLLLAAVGLWAGERLELARATLPAWSLRRPRFPRVNLRKLLPRR